MNRARAHLRRARLAPVELLALAPGLAGPSPTGRRALGRHVPTPSYSGARYYPFLLVGVKIAIALMLAALTWRFFKARAAAHAARRLLVRMGAPVGEAPRMRIQLSLRSWAIAYGLTAGFYL